MLIDDYLPLEELLKCVDHLSPDLDAIYGIRGSLIPRWKNFFTFQVDRFDRYPEMITHGSTHICNVLTLAAELLVPVLNSRKTPTPLSGEELFLLIAGIFLHDIGMADVARQSLRPDEVRKRHSVLSGEIIRSRFRKGDRSPANLLPTFESCDEVDVISEICIHHQTKAPIARKDRKKGNTAPTLEELLDLHEHLGFFNGKSIDIYLVTALLRVLDACDVQYSRAGSVFITESKIRNNERLRAECRKREAMSTGDLQVFYQKYEEYLKAQETDHFPKHSVIQKVWIINQEVVYRPITKRERKLLCCIMPEAALEPELFYEEFENEIQRELSICKLYLEKKKLALSGVRRFDEDRDPDRIMALPTFRKSWTSMPVSTAPYRARKGFENRIVAAHSGADAQNGKNIPWPITVFVAPDGSGKTALAANLAGQLKSRRRICYIPVADLKGENQEKILRFIATRMTRFLAAWGDYLFYNKIRMEMEMEEAQWDILFDEANRPENLFIFDDLHALPLYTKSSAVYRFMRQFFERFGGEEGKGTVWVFSRKIPYPLTRLTDLRFEVREMPAFSGPEIDALAGSRKFTGFDPGVWPEGREAVRSLIERRRNFPVILSFIREAAGQLPRMDADAADWFRTSVEHRMAVHIDSVMKTVETPGRHFLEWVQRYPAAADHEPETVAGWFGSDVETARDGRACLEDRNLLYKDWPRRLRWTEKLWRLDDPEVEASVMADIPELAPMEGLDQGVHHRLDGWDHTLAVVDNLRRMLETPETGLGALPFPALPDILLLAGLLHDVGKPACREETDKGVQFIGHDQAGAEAVREIGPRLNLSAEEIDALDALVRHHMHPLSLIGGEPPTPKALNRFIRKTEPHTTDLLLLAEADLAASGGDAAQTAEDLQRLRQLIASVLHLMETAQAAEKSPPILIGKDLKDLDVPPGPIYKKILAEALERQFEEGWTAREPALAWLRERVKNLSSE